MAWWLRRSDVKRKDAGSIPRFGSPILFKKHVIYGHCLVTVPCTINETLNELTSLAHLDAEVILVVVTVQRLDINSISPLSPPTPYCHRHGGLVVKASAS